MRLALSGSATSYSLGPAAGGPERDRAWVVVGSFSAWTNAAAEAYRSAGSFSMAVWTAAATWSGTAFRMVLIGSGSLFRTLATIAWTVGPVKGGSPVSIS